MEFPDLFFRLLTNDGELARGLEMSNLLRRYRVKAHGTLAKWVNGPGVAPAPSAHGRSNASMMLSRSIASMMLSRSGRMLQAQADRAAEERCVLGPRGGAPPSSHPIATC